MPLHIFPVFKMVCKSFLYIKEISLLFVLSLFSNKLYLGNRCSQKNKKHNRLKGTRAAEDTGDVFLYLLYFLPPSYPPATISLSLFISMSLDLCVHIHFFFYLIHLKVFSFRLSLLCFRSKKTLNIAWDIIIGLNLALIRGIDFHNYFYVFVIIIGRNKEERRQHKLIYYAKCAILSLFVFFRGQLLLLSSYR